MFAGQALSVTLGFAERIRRLFQAKGVSGGGVMSSSWLHVDLHGSGSVPGFEFPLFSFPFVRFLAPATWQACHQLRGGGNNAQVFAFRPGMAWLRENAGVMRG